MVREDPADPNFKEERGGFYFPDNEPEIHVGFCQRKSMAGNSSVSGICNVPVNLMPDSSGPCLFFRLRITKRK